MNWKGWQGQISYVEERGDLMKVQKEFWILGISFFVLLVITVVRQRDQLFLAALSKADPPVTIVIDAGHGGSDPGKIGIHGEEEKDINLSISLLVEKLLKKQHINVVMTRNTDTDLSNASDQNKKKSDLIRRRELFEQTDPALVVSIHQNSYPDPSIFGGQVFYYEGSGQGKQLAACLQQSISSLDPRNKRQIKANSTYYILKSAISPVVICECGFLSNEEECSNLNAPAYQEKLAKAIVTGILNYLYQSK